MDGTISNATSLKFRYCGIVTKVSDAEKLTTLFAVQEYFSFFFKKKLSTTRFN